MYAGHILVLFLVLTICLTIVFAFVKIGDQNDDDSEQKKLLETIDKLEKQLDDINEELEENEAVYRENQRNLEEQLNAERMENHTNEEQILEMKAEYENQNARLQQNQRELTREAQKLATLETQLSEERRKNNNKDVRLQEILDEQENERRKQMQYLEEKERNFQIEKQKLETLGEQLKALNEQKSNGKNNELEIQKANLERERKAQEERLKDEQNKLRVNIDSMRRQQQQQQLPARPTLQPQPQHQPSNSNTKGAINATVSGESVYDRQNGTKTQPQSQPQQQSSNPNTKGTINATVGGESVYDRQNGTHTHPQSQPQQQSSKPNTKGTINATVSGESVYDRQKVRAPQPQSQQQSSHPNTGGTSVYDDQMGRQTQSQNPQQSSQRNIGESTISAVSDASAHGQTRNQLPKTPNEVDKRKETNVAPPAQQRHNPEPTAPAAATSSEPAKHEVPIENRFVKANEIQHEKNWVDVSKLSVVMTAEIGDALMATAGTKDIANKYCIMKIPDSALPPGSSIDRKVKKSLQVGENKDGMPRRFARMKIIMSGESAPTMFFHDYTPVIKNHVFYDFKQDTVLDQKGCSWKEFNVHVVHLGTEKLTRITKVALLLKSDVVKPSANKNKNNKKKNKK